MFLKVEEPPPQFHYDDNPKTIVAAMRDLYELDRETIVIFHLDWANRVTLREMVALGKDNSACLSMQETFRSAMRMGTRAFILVHNHPGKTSSARPSQADINTTYRMIACCRMLDIKLIDHIIIASSGSYFSFQGAGYLESWVEQFKEVLDNFREKIPEHLAWLPGVQSLRQHFKRVRA